MNSDWGGGGGPLPHHRGSALTPNWWRKNPLPYHRGPTVKAEWEKENKSLPLHRRSAVKEKIPCHTTEGLQ